MKDPQGIAAGRHAIAPWERWAAAIVWVVSLALVIWPLLGHWWIFTNDGPQHLYGAWLFHHPEALSATERPLVELHNPLTSNAVRLLFGPLDDALGWREAWRAVHIVLMVGFHTALSLALVLGRPDRWWMLATTPVLCWNYLVYMGLLNFIGGLPLALGILWLAGNSPSWGGLRGVMLAALLVLCGSLHLFAADLAGLGLFCMALVRTMREPSAWARHLPTVALIGLPLLGYTWMTTVSYEEVAMSSHVVFERWPGGDDPSTFLNTGVGGPAWRALLPVLLATAGLVWGTLGRLRPSSPESEWPAFWWLFGVACALAWCLLPYSISGWQVLSPRSAILAVLAGMCCLPALPLAVLRFASAAVLMIWSIAGIAWSVDFQRRAEEGCADLLHALERDADLEGMQSFVAWRTCLPARGYVDTPELPRVSLVRSMGAGLAVSHRSLYRGFHGKPAIHTYTMRWITPYLGPRRDGSLWMSVGNSILHTFDTTTEPTQWVATMAPVVEQSAITDHTWIFGQPVLRSAMEILGMEVVTLEGDLAFSEFVGCPAEAVVSRADDQLMALEYGWAGLPADAWFGRLEIEARATGAVMPLEQAGCGPLWVRGLSGPQDAPVPLRCAEAGPDGLVWVPPASPGAVRRVSCTLP